MSTIRETLTSATKALQTSKTSPAALEAEVLLLHILKKPKEFLYSNPEFKLSETAISNFQFLISRRVKGEPIAYLTGHKEFYGLDFIVNKNVLIPRPETELLIEETLKCTGGSRPAPTTLYSLPATIADIGTGSGCIAVTLAKNLPQTKIYATDRSAPALKIAKENAARHGVAKQITFKRGDLLLPLRNVQLDIIVANLPYLDIKTRSLAAKRPETRGLDFEPQQALYAGPKGFDVFLKFFKQLALRSQRPNLVILEIGHNQAHEIKKLIKKILPEYQAEIKKDLAGHNRLAILKK